MFSNMYIKIKGKTKCLQMLLVRPTNTIKVILSNFFLYWYFIVNNAFKKIYPCNFECQKVLTPI